MRPFVEPVEADRDLPERAEVVVIGGGIIGVSTALSLAEKGVRTVLCEKGRIGGEQSSRNWGWCRKMGRDPAELPLSVESLRLWERMNERVGAETGFRRSGIVYLCETERELDRQRTWLDGVKGHDLDTRLIGPDEVAAVLPGAARRWAGGLHTPSDGRAEPDRAVPAMARAARGLGATILTECAVRGIETGGGRVTGVVTERGPIACDAVVLAGGAWSRLFCGNAGIELPQLKILGSVFRTGPVEGAPESAAGAGDFAFRKRLDGGYVVSHRSGSIAEIVPDSFRLFFRFLPALREQRPYLRLRFGRRFFEEWRRPRRWALDRPTPFEAVRVLDPEPADAVIRQAKANLVRDFPAFRDMVEVERWGGLVDVTPDAVPVMSPVDRIPGFFVATGFSGHGFGIGPGAGRLVADLVTGDRPIVDPAPFRLSRFARARASRIVRAAAAQASP